MIQEARLLELFKSLCLINAPSLQERECVDWTKSYLQGIGLEIQEDSAGAAIGSNANNLIATLKGTKPGAPRTFLSAHIDTVEPTAGLQIIEEDGVLKSDGATILGADDKGGMAPAIEAVHALKESGEPHGDVVLLFTLAEEIGLKGAAAMELEDLNFDYGYVLDTGPPVGSFVTRTATHDALEITIHGKASHSGKYPERGVDAIQIFARAIANMPLGRIEEELTANVGVVNGGTAVNVVCPLVTARAEARGTDVAKLDAQVDRMIQEFERAASERGGTVEIERERHYDAYEIQAGQPCLEVAQRAARTLGFDGNTRTTLGGSDANIFNAKGAPCIVLGTGMREIHTHAENIAIQDLLDTARLTCEILLEAAR